MNIQSLKYDLLKIPTKSKHGGFIATRKETDFFASGGILPNKILMPGGQWHQAIPVKEIQKRQGFDNMSCVSMGSLNQIETFMRAVYGEDYNFSDRFTAKMSNTQPNGNSVDNVADSLRNDGVLDEGLWPWTEDLDTWAEYFSTIPDELKNRAKLFLDDNDIMHDWIFFGNSPMAIGWVPPLKRREMMMQYLEYAPLGITWRWSDAKDSEGRIKKAFGEANHFSMLYGYKENEYWEVYDHYDDVKKRLVWDYEIWHCKRYHVAKRLNGNPELLKKYEGKYIQRVMDRGQVYKVENATVKFLDSEKDPITRHIPLVDASLNELTKMGRLVGITEDEFKRLT